MLYFLFEWPKNVPDRRIRGKLYSLETGIDELIISLVPITGTGEDEQQLAQLMHLIG